MSPLRAGACAVLAILALSACQSAPTPQELRRQQQEEARARRDARLTAQRQARQRRAAEQRRAQAAARPPAPERPPAAAAAPPDVADATADAVADAEPADHPAPGIFRPVSARVVGCKIAAGVDQLRRLPQPDAAADEGRRRLMDRFQCIAARAGSEWQVQGASAEGGHALLSLRGIGGPYNAGAVTYHFRLDDMVDDEGRTPWPPGEAPPPPSARRAAPAAGG